MSQHMTQLPQYLYDCMAVVVDDAETTAAAAAVTATTVAVTTRRYADTSSDVVSLTGIFDCMDVLSLILSFVGPNQYRFVAHISQKFCAAYAHTFNSIFVLYSEGWTFWFSEMVTRKWLPMGRMDVWASSCSWRLGNAGTDVGPRLWREWKYSLWSSRTRLPTCVEMGLYQLAYRWYLWGHPTYEIAQENGHVHITEWMDQQLGTGRRRCW